VALLARVVRTYLFIHRQEAILAKRNIPQIRARLRELADEHGLDELHDLADDTYRNAPVTRAKRKSTKFTAPLAAKIRGYHKKHPRLHQRDIAHKFNVNPGRVSEALTNQK
jgi:hypothetical protein